MELLSSLGVLNKPSLSFPNPSRVDGLPVSLSLPPIPALPRSQLSPDPSSPPIPALPRSQLSPDPSSPPFPATPDSDFFQTAIHSENHCQPTRTT
ncbi:hypothetical protein PGT21_033333 [Puccinia graminis f. sp. tritici]|uniref:Uncharacterized protein n=1 Tax=Puccinia graminis f. sp. tritici TaxID=56615 RepID=A0A5B0MYE7_PUCGR|nr:hypothetical protein PGT21_033333 [Puccinia graminis f. sp. tritici]KAA1081857.1 hypothetical protein PGTUg99_019240 [Puccinia graminis f. sp. tritici]